MSVRVVNKHIQAISFFGRSISFFVFKLEAPVKLTSFQGLSSCLKAYVVHVFIMPKWKCTSGISNVEVV